MENSALVLEAVNLVHTQLGIALPRKKRTRGSGTHSEEWIAGCARCYVQTGSAGSDRLIIWPDAPAYGAKGRDNYPLMCRRCSDKGNGWYGDIIAYVMDALQMRYPEALEFLGIENTSVKKHGQPRPVRALFNLPPDEAWRKAGDALVKEAASLLWSEDGKDYLAYLHERGLTDKIIREAHLGCVVSWQRYDDAAAWGLSGSRIRIPPGIVIPEYHRDSDGHIELWSIAIRLDEDYRELQYEETTEKPDKYHVVRGGTKGMYGYESLKAGKPALMCEGQIDALSALQAYGDEIGVVATQSTTGARNERWHVRLSYCSVVLLAFDNDEAGREALTHWVKTLEGTGFPIKPTKHDINDMLVGGEDIKAWIDGVIAGFQIPVEAPSLTNERAEETKGIDGPLEEENAQILILGATGGIEALPVKCHLCDRGVEDETVEFQYTPEGKLICSLCASPQPRCFRCQQIAKYQTENIWWCGMHVTSAQMLELGAKRRYVAFDYDGGDGHAFAQDGSVHVVSVDGGHVEGGRQNYIEFCCQAPEAEVGRALYVMHLYATGQRKPVVAAPVRVIKTPCARAECTHDASVPVRFWSEHKFQTEQGVQYGRLVSGAVDSFGNHWCPRCLQCMHLLEEAERRHFPVHIAHKKNESGDFIPVELRTFEDWLNFVVNASIFEIIFEWDALRREVAYV